MSDENVPYIGEEDLDRISDLLEAWESGRLNPTVIPPPRPLDQPPIETRLAQALTDVPALHYGSVSTSSGTKGNQPIPGAGMAEIWIMDFVALDLTDTTFSLPVYNLFPIKVYAGDWIVLCRDPGSGQYFCVFPGLGHASSASSASASASASGGSGSGNGVTVVTDVTCGGSGSANAGGGLHVTDGILTGSVNINGTNYPVTFHLGTGGS
jgi:hypothetical protein